MLGADGPRIGCRRIPPIEVGGAALESLGESTADEQGHGAAKGVETIGHRHIDVLRNTIGSLKGEGDGGRTIGLEDEGCRGRGRDSKERRGRREDEAAAARGGMAAVVQSGREGRGGSGEETRVVVGEGDGQHGGMG